MVVLHVCVPPQPADAVVGIYMCVLSQPAVLTYMYTLPQVQHADREHTCTTPPQGKEIEREKMRIVYNYTIGTAGRDSWQREKTNIQYCHWDRRLWENTHITLPLGQKTEGEYARRTLPLFVL